MEQSTKSDLVLIKNGTLLEPNSGVRNRIDLLIRNGKIDQLGFSDTDFAGLIVDASDHLIIPGLLDMHVHLREPGREDEETIETGCAAAMAGGFTAVCAMPNTEPACDNQEVVKFLKKRAENELVDVLPIGAITKRRAGLEITEMAEMLRAGAVAFSDDGSPVSNSQVMRHALEYAAMYDALIIDHCEDTALFTGGHMNESYMSTRLGLPGIPDSAEEIMIARDIALARLTGGRIHIAHISTARGVELVRRAKNDGISVTCEVTPHHLVLDDEALEHYNTNFKMNPPLRTAADVAALKDALKDGTIDVFASDHAPHSIEEKDVEFIAAPFGIIGVETMLPIILTHIVHTGILPLEKVLVMMSSAPRDLLRLPRPELLVGAVAELTIVNPDVKTAIQAKNLKSLSKNMPYEGWELFGHVLGVLARNRIWLKS